jgi:hypothetical protein
MKFLLGTMWVMIRPATSAILIALRVESHIGAVLPAVIVELLGLFTALKQIDSRGLSIWTIKRVFSVGDTGYGVSCIVGTPARSIAPSTSRVISFGNY